MKHQKRISALPALCALLLAACPFASNAQTADPLLNALVKKGILTLDEASEIKSEVDNSTNLPPSNVVLGRGHASKIRLEGYLQGNVELGDVSAFEGRLRSGPDQIYDRFRLRRARIGVMGDLWNAFDFKLEGDFQQNDGIGTRSAFSASDIFINWHTLPEANLKLGQFMSPFGYEMLLPDVGPGPMMLTAERSLVTIATVPERQIGVQLWGAPLARIAPDYKELFTYSAGIFNGNGRNFLTNDNNQFMYMGRAETVPISGKLLDMPVRWRVGVNAFYSQDEANANLSPIGNLFFDPVAADGSLVAFNTHTKDKRTAWGIDQTFSVGPLDISAEYIADQVHAMGLSPSFSSFTARGYYVQPSLFIWDRQLQLVGKWERFDPGQGPHEEIRSATVGLNWYIYGQNVVAMVNLIHTWSDFRKFNPGLGPDEFNELLLRLEVFF